MELLTDRSTKESFAVVLRNGAFGEKHQIETMTGGVALLDFDNDGLLDVYFVNGASQPSLRKTDPSYFNRLYRNKGDGTFEDVTQPAGVPGEGYEMGAAAGDFDNDGFTDLFVTGVNHTILYHNKGNGTFENVTVKAGVKLDQWSVSAGWFDFDNDGQLDLFVVNYVKWDPAREPFCGAGDRSYRTYCHPRFYESLPNTLFHNNGDGTFTDVSREAGIMQHPGKGMGLAFADYDGDGRLDVFVANDTTRNFLFHNDGNGRFTEAGIGAGIAFNDDGRALSSMGVDFRDMDNDGRPDVFITALANETFPFYRNLGKGLFSDMTYPSRIGSATIALSGWSTGIFDFDNDGLKDIFTANGDVQDNVELFSSRKSRQANSILLNRGGGRFEAHTAGRPAFHRGAAFSDFDGDGRVDVVVTRLNERPILLRNTLSPQNHWVGLRLVGGASNRDAIGATVHLVSAGGQQWNHVTTSVGYASSSDRLVHFGLGRDTEAALIEIRWPSGKQQRLEHVKAGHYLTVREP